MNLIQKLTVIFMAALVVLFLMGNLIGTVDNCSSIGECKACWRTAPTNLMSELCPLPNETCTAQPYQMQNNAIVDVVLCACEKASAKGYSDSDMNTRIAEVYRLAFGYEMTAQQICSDPGTVLMKMDYG